MWCGCAQRSLRAGRPPERRGPAARRSSRRGPRTATVYRRKDPFHQRAKREGYRSRAAYKLAEIQREKRVMRRGDRVVDLGCWPGGWLQVAAEAVGPEGRVVGVDVAEISAPLELENVVAIRGDLAGPGLAEQIVGALGGSADVLLSDAAPKLTGVRVADRAHEEALLEAIEALIPSLLRVGGTLVLKVLEGPEAQVVARRIRGRFERSGGVRPAAAREGTTERYLVAQGYLGPAGD